MRSTRSARRHWLLAAAAACASHSGWAGEPPDVFPRRSVRLVVPYAVGVGPDVVARSLAQALSAQWHQPVLVDNRAGASGIVAFSELRRVPADGHTLFLADTATLVVNPLLHADLPYDPGRDLVPLTLLFRATFLIWVGSDSRFRTLGALLDAARRTKEQVSYGTLGNGHASHVAIESMAHASGVRLLHVPFKDAGALFTAVASGAVDFTAFSMNTMAGLYAAGRLRPLAVAAQTRLPEHPDIPTLREAGGPALTMHPWAALVAVAGTPPAVLEQLQQDLQAALGLAEVHKRATQAGFELTPSTPQGLRDRVAADRAQVQPLIEDGRISRL